MATKKKLLQAAAGQAGGGAALNVEDVFSTYLYQGNGSTQTITNGIDLDGEGGLTWIKSRGDNGAGPENHQLFDTERGANKVLQSNSTLAEATYTQRLTSFNSDGFSVGSDYDVNNPSPTFASWTFRKAPKFFDVVTYTGDGVNGREIAHDLGCDVGFMIVKRTDTTSSWHCWHNSGTTTNGYIELDQASTYSTYTGLWNNTSPTSTAFTLGTDSVVNASGGTYVAYLFAHNDGDGDFGADGDADIIKCGSVTIGGSGNATVNLGFEPQWLMVKNATSGGYDWQILDTMRGFRASPDNNAPALFANTSGSESGQGDPNLTSTGFEWDGGGGAPNQTYIYMAIRRGTKVPESADEVFSLALRDTSKPHFNATSSHVDMAFKIYTLSGYGDSWKKYIQSRLTGTRHLKTNSNETEGINSENTWDHHNGWSEDPGSVDYFSWMWKRAPGFFDAVAYTGSSPAFASAINHNLGVVPEMMWVKNRNGTSGGTRPWIVYHKDTGNAGYFKLNETSALITSDPESKFGNTNVAVGPTADVFYVAGDYEVNYSGDTYIAYLFASLDGISKVGSYTGNGSSQTIDCGFTSGARFVLIKRTDSTSDWFVLDSERGIVAGNDPLLALNGNGAESTGYDIIDPESSGFIINETAWNTNVSGASYIFYAIA
ncbi:hypothetical protein CRP13_gp45 [Roseobacter phage CRP-13]|nr:hypothetical protein CRP13_gp45 [Roseobacter phage CRP-13]